jgi:tRNA pseudouridine38-40 synthase
MPRYRLTIEYDGGPFVGWQRQDNGLGVQQVIEEAIERFCGERARVHCAGRTDAGVHAIAQVAHVDLEREAEDDTVRDALNFHIKPHPVAVLEAARVPGGDDGFHARFSAVSRRYLYRITCRRAPLALDRGRAWWVPRTLDAAAMGAGAQRLIGRHDFTTFRAKECQAESPVKTLDVLDVERDGEEIRVHARARSFLHHQVRNIVGTLALVGERKWTPDDVTRALEARDRGAGGPTAPACGLYLVEVGYEEAG